MATHNGFPRSIAPGGSICWPVRFRGPIAQFRASTGAGVPLRTLRSHVDGRWPLPGALGSETGKTWLCVDFPGFDPPPVSGRFSDRFGVGFLWPARCDRMTARFLFQVCDLLRGACLTRRGLHATLPATLLLQHGCLFQRSPSPAVNRGGRRTPSPLFASSAISLDNPFLLMSLGGVV